jgi:hypothetical protein
MADDDLDDDDGFDTGLAAISDLRNTPAAPPPAPVEPKVIGGDTPRTPEEIRAGPGYKWLADWFARGGEAARQPQTIEDRFYGPKR